MKIRELPWIQNYDVESIVRPPIEGVPVDGWRTFYPSRTITIVATEPRILIDLSKQCQTRIKIFNRACGDKRRKRSSNLKRDKPNRAARKA